MTGPTARLWLAAGRGGQRVLRRPFAIGLRAVRSRRTRIVLLDGQGQVALARVWLSPQRWELPGGGLRRGEDPVAGGARELSEEVGVSDVVPPGLQVLGELTDPTGVFTAVLLVGVAVDPSTLRIPSRHRWEIVEVAWWPIDTMPPDCDALVHQALVLLAS